MRGQPVTPQELNEIRDRLRSCPKCHGTGVIHVRVETAGYMGSYTEESCYPCRARIVQSWPALLAEIDRLRAENHQAWSEGHAAAMGAMLDQVEQQRHEARAEVDRLTIAAETLRWVDERANTDDARCIHWAAEGWDDWLAGLRAELEANQ